MSVQELRARLPQRIDRQFRPWSYTVSHRQLVLRSDRNFEFGETVYVTFLDVLAMQLRHSYERLEIAEATNIASINRFVDIPERHSHRYIRLALMDGVHEGFVVCGALDVRIEPPEP